MNHLAHFVNDTVDQIDLSPIFAVYERESRGYPPYHPAMPPGSTLHASWQERVKML
ncbi:hypothetical protein [Sulfoacidibacillus ferrooxidans]|uniref:Uncharacterized protein n=1 Tax=Sulfoacidibacillus ferrooxidans TaxID=2005001 RepID=A0A9X2AGC3_9BACL|nr:hypothetical protein [Sulfoacidibacillus ferrooxidans]MCI0184916.1 hypothetical protein [Sulfoacidibacillus ferrooxidans]